MPNSKKNKANGKSDSKILISSPLSQENDIKANNPLKAEEFIFSEVKRLIFSKDFINLSNEIKSCFDQKNKFLRKFPILIKFIKEKNGFESEEFKNGGKKDGLFRKLTTRLKLAEKIDDPISQKIFSYLDKEFVTLDQEKIKVVQLGDKASYDKILAKLKTEPAKATELKERLFGILDELEKLSENKPTFSSKETTLQIPQETKIDPVFFKEKETTQVKQSIQQKKLSEIQSPIKPKVASLKEVMPNNKLGIQTKISSAINLFTFFLLKEQSVNSSSLPCSAWRRFII